MKYPQNGSLKGVSTLLLAAGPKGKLMETQFGQQWMSSIYRLFLFLSTACNLFYDLAAKVEAAKPDRKLLKLPIQGHVQAKLAS